MTKSALIVLAITQGPCMAIQYVGQHNRVDKLESLTVFSKIDRLTIPYPLPTTHLTLYQDGRIDIEASKGLFKKITYTDIEGDGTVDRVDGWIDDSYHMVDRALSFGERKQEILSKATLEYLSQLERFSPLLQQQETWPVVGLHRRK